MTVAKPGKQTSSEYQWKETEGSQHFSWWGGGGSRNEQTKPLEKDTDRGISVTPFP
jgi:hypothetical protein